MLDLDLFKQIASLTRKADLTLNELSIVEQFEDYINLFSAKDLLDLIPKEEQDRVFHQRMCDISPEFLGFITTYRYLSLLIPKHFTVVDCGCAYNPQCYYFTNHAKYIAIDLPDGVGEVFKAPNCEYYPIGIAKYIAEHVPTLNLDETFAICNYVPPWGQDNMELVRKSFKNCYTFYPNGGYTVKPFKRSK